MAKVAISFRINAQLFFIFSKLTLQLQLSCFELMQERHIYSMTKRLDDAYALTYALMAGAVKFYVTSRLIALRSYEHCTHLITLTMTPADAFKGQIKNE